MKKLQLKIALVAILFATACYNPNSSTSEERDDETTPQVQDHGAHNAQSGMHGSDTSKMAPATKVKEEKTEPHK